MIVPTLSLRFFVIAAFVTQLLARPTRLDSIRRDSNCTDPTVRVNWLTLTDDEKTTYFEAELCLLSLPAQTSIPGVITRYDDLVGAHSMQADTGAGTDLWHTTGQFLAAHRYYMHTHEILLREECGYTGALPYWYELEDAGAFNESAVLTAFGGEGFEENDYVIVEGPFANLTRNLGPGATNTPHLLARQMSWWNSTLANQTYFDEVNAQTTFALFQSTLNPTIHTAGHRGVGGDLENILTSPNDPVFFLHHTYLDWVWWKWQGDNETRIYNLKGAGYETQSEPATGWVETSAETSIWVYDIIPNITVGDVLYTQGGYLCYIYA
ncbi:hypothetical protein DFS33DRAFT_626885 [Desarmillaria ectypa]|nr:hypothetical protein DFS33DRAFT_626885 [Desarmillaria ectypa]